MRLFRFVSLMLPAFLILTAQAFGQSITPAEVATLTVENDLSVRQADLRLESAYRTFLRQRAASGPSLSLSGSLPGGNTYTVSVDTGDDDPTHRAGLALRYSQSLPAGGSLSAGLTHSLTSTSDQVTQSPGASIGYSMPIFVNGKLFEPALTGAAYRGAEFGYRKTEAATVDSRNAAVIASLQLYITVVQTRDRIAILEREIALDQETLRQLSVSQEQGRTPISDVWEAEIALEAKQDQLFQRSQELQLNERALAGRLGMGDAVESLELSREIPAISLDSDVVRTAIVERSLAGPRIDVESAELSAATAGRQYGANLGVSLSINPVHPTGFAGETLGVSFGEFGSDDTSIVVTAGLALALPLYESGAKGHESARVAAEVERARVAVEQSRSAVESEVEQDILAERLILERVEYDRRRVELARRRAEEVEQLFAIQTVSAADVTNAQLQVQRRVLEAWGTKADLMIVRLQLLRRAGEDLTEVLRRN